MADVEKALIGTWNVSFNQYQWIYTFAEGGKVTWRDRWNGQTGGGTWKAEPGGVSITWQKSTTVETWSLPIMPSGQTGQITASYASGQLLATKDQTRFDSFAPEGQLDAFACWAACLAWYTKVSADVTTVSQQAIIGRSNAATWAANGAITMNGLMMLSLPNVFLERSRIDAGELQAKVAARRFPMLIGFSSGPLGGHVNVLHSYDGTTVGVMEPWFPDPAKNSAYDFDGTVFFHKKTGDPFRFTGTMTKRPLSYYASKPLNGEFLIAMRA